MGEINNDYEKALQSYHAEKFEETYIHLKNAIQFNPSHLPSQLLLGKVYQQRDNTLSAIA
jgi:hypothetical protein